MLVSKKTLILFNFIWLAIYFTIFFNLDYKINLDQLFVTTDAKEYWTTSTEFFSFNQGNSIIRPFLYPFILLVFYHPFGPYGLWLIQFLFWIGSVNLIFFALIRLTKSLSVSFISSLLFAINVTIVVLSFHALTELTTIFLLSILVYYLSKHFSNIRTTKVLHICLLLLALLTVVKPLFYLPLLAILLLACPLFYWREYKTTPKKLGILFLVILPVLFQLSMMKLKYDKFTISEISSLTFKNYILTQVIARKDEVKWDQALEAANKIKSSEMKTFILEHKFHFKVLLLQNLRANIDAVPTYLSLPKHFKHPKFKKFMSNLNSFHYHLHLSMIIPLFICLIITFIKKNYALFTFVLAVATCILYIFLTSAISFYQGDRLTIIAVPLFVVLYGYLVHFYLTLFKSIYYRKQGK